MLGIFAQAAAAEAAKAAVAGSALLANRLFPVEDAGLPRNRSFQPEVLCACGLSASAAPSAVASGASPAFLPERRGY